MKHILLHWLTFFVLFFGTVALGYSLNFDPNVVIVILLVLYFLFQGLAIRYAYKKGGNWIYASIIVQVLFAVLSPLYYSNFGDPVYEFVTGQWFDSVDQLDPCHLCWWARIMMFPLLPLSIIAFVTKSRPILGYIYGVSFLGMALEVFHYILQKPWIIGQASINNPFGCTAANPCAALHVDYMGVITIPLLCLVAFLVVNILAYLALFSKKIDKATKRI